jgi:hypothetical protein
VRSPSPSRVAIVRVYVRLVRPLWHFGSTPGIV